ncbi:probable G-protein coupled receptor 139 [Heterodontus francisci]|uniref:probable G-protein coupled receptor 139 n=1 Tax=Heterodontus francisci TaxID=7792 RepID=UPI00355B5885
MELSKVAQYLHELLETSYIRGVFKCMVQGDFNVMMIVILSRGNCGLSKCITRYLVAMAVADLLVIIFDLILRHIPAIYRSEFTFVRHIPLCNIHAVVLYAVTDCSVWFTVSFTFDRYIAICWQKLKTKYCVEKTANVVLTIITVLFSLKNIFFYFMYTNKYSFVNHSWFCVVTDSVAQSKTWGTVEFLHYILNPCIPFVLVLLFNALTIRYILVANRARRRLRSHVKVESLSDPEMENRRKSMIILYGVSGNFILLWALYMIWSIYWRMAYLGYETVYLPVFVRELAFMFQLTACCTNTCIYAVIQRKFRDEMKNLLQYPFVAIVKLIKKLD